MEVTEREIEILKRIDAAGVPIHTKTWRDVHPFSITGLKGKGLLESCGVQEVGKRKRKMILYQLTDAGKAAIK